jgi:acylphosphatase
VFDFCFEKLTLSPTLLPPAPAPVPASLRSSSQSPLKVISLTLEGADGRLTCFSEHRGFRRYVVASADAIGITGTIQRYHDTTVRLVFEASENQLERFVSFLRESSAMGMISRICDYHQEPLDYRMHATFKIVRDFSRTVVRGGGVVKGPYSDDDADKLSVYSADSNRP